MIQRKRKKNGRWKPCGFWLGRRGRGRRAKWTDLRLLNFSLSIMNKLSLTHLPKMAHFTGAFLTSVNQRVRKSFRRASIVVLAESFDFTLRTGWNSKSNRFYLTFADSISFPTSFKCKIFDVSIWLPNDSLFNTKSKEPTLKRIIPRRNHNFKCKIFSISSNETKKHTQKQKNK